MDEVAKVVRVLNEDVAVEAVRFAVRTDLLVGRARTEEESSRVARATFSTRNTRKLTPISSGIVCASRFETNRKRPMTYRPLARAGSSIDPERTKVVERVGRQLETLQSVGVGIDDPWRQQGRGVRVRVHVVLVGGIAALESMGSIAADTAPIASSSSGESKPVNSVWVTRMKPSGSFRVGEPAE